MALVGFIAVMVLLPASGVRAQADRDSTFKVVVSLGGGLTRDLGAANVQTPGSDYEAGGLGGSFRVLWHPDHLLMAGLETGYFRVSMLTLSSDTAGDRSVSLNALPMLVVFAMTKYGFEISGGLGLYRYSVIAESGRTGLRGGSYSNEIGYMASLGYAFRLSRRFEAGADLKLHFIPDREITAMLLQARVSYRLVEY
jgi:hypothetical protein